MNANKRILPPRWPRRFFEWHCSPEVAEDLTGDMDELFYSNLKKMPVRKARLKYLLQTFTLIFSYAVRHRKRNYRQDHDTASYHSWAMYRSYSKIAFRNLARQKTFSIINVICLSVGMSVGLLALAAFVDMLEVDRQHLHADNIYRITTETDDGNEKATYASTSAPLADKLQEGAAGVRAVVRVAKDFNPEVVQSANTALPLTGYYASQNFFDVFTFPLTNGDAARALEKPFSVVITESAALKLFNDTRVLGKIIEVKELGSFEVTGVVKDYPRSHLYFEILASYSTLAILEQQHKVAPSLRDWGPRTDHYTYVLLDDAQRVSGLQSSLANATGQFKEPTVKVSYRWQALTDIPTTELRNEVGLTWGYMVMVVFFALALLVLLPACSNYTNIAIARAMKRAKEIGLRKVSGGQSRHIFGQMVMETIIIAVLSLGGAMLIFQVIRNQFLDMIVHGNRTFDLEITPATFIVFFLFAVLTGFLAGVFPALYFSRLNPIETLRNASQTSKLSKVSIRKGLIVAQFALSMVFILGVAIIVKQYQHALNYDMGFQKENILDIPLKGEDGKLLQTELSRIPEITTISMSSSVPGRWEGASTWVRTPETTDSLEVYQMFTDEAYIDNLEIDLIAGKRFPLHATHREEYIIVNETFVKKFDLGSPFDALDKSFIVDGNKALRIAGVVKDFNFMPLQLEIGSFFFRCDPAQVRIANVKLKSTDIRSTLARIERAWSKVSAQKFEAYFLDDELDDSLVSIVSMMRIFGFLGALAITISCLGLLAVVISAAESRTREMGIRKVMGATVSDLAIALSKGFIKLIAIAIAIATPFTYLLFDKIFLTIQFYRASIGITEIAVSVALLFGLVLIIVGSQTLRVARINPVETLKSE